MTQSSDYRQLGEDWAPVDLNLGYLGAAISSWSQRGFDVFVTWVDRALDPKGWTSDRTAFAAEFERQLPVPRSSSIDPSPQPIALRTFERLKDLLTLDDQQAAALVGISRNTPRDWRNGNQPRGATTRRLYEVAAVVDLVATRQTDMAAWARGPAPTGRSWIQLLAEPDGPATVLRELRGDLLVAKPVQAWEVAPDDDTGNPLSEGGPSSDIVSRRASPRRRPR